MATIYSNRNDNTGSHTTVDPNVGSTWAGNAVPATTDLVYVVGRRTQINQAAFSKWTGTRTITVDSTSNFATSGFFYVNTAGGEIVKVEYTGTTSTTFTGCSINETDSFYSWNSGQTITDNAYVHNPAYIIEIGTDETFECDEMIIQEGGWVYVNGGTLIINKGLQVFDGRLIGASSGTITIQRNSAALTLMGYLYGANYPISIIDINGEEVRAYSTLSSAASAGDASVSINSVTNGSFAEGDEVAIYVENDYRRKKSDYPAYRDHSWNFRDMDEGFDVAGVSGNTVYLALRNSAKGVVKGVTTLGSQKVVEVLPDNVYFNAGDKIIIDNSVYTVDSVEDSEFPAYSYDFTDDQTDLSDFWVGASDHIYSSSWSIENGVGLRNTSGAYRELIHKYLWTREVILEAEMSPLSAYTSGTRGTAAFGLCAAYDPSFRWGHRGYESFKSDYLAIDDAGQDFIYYIRSVSNYNNNRPDRVTAVLNATRTAATYKVISRKGTTKVLFNGEEFTEEFRRDGHYKGLVGVYTNGNTSFRCKSLSIKLATQKLYVTTGNSISVDSTVYRTGIEHNHPSGSKIVKIASINTGGGSHKDLGFAFRGQYGNGEWPLVTQLNGSNATNSTLPYLHNHDANVDYYYNLGTGTGPYSITLDLTAQKTFTHVSFLPRMAESTANSGLNGYNGVSIYGSNDGTNWTTLYDNVNDTKKWSNLNYNRIGFYSTGTVSYRYVKFETRGDQSGNLNRYKNIGVHDFSEGYTLTLNNASDFNIGDTVTVMSDSGYSWSSRELEAYYSSVTYSTDPETLFHGGWKLECEITNKVGNKIYLDRPIFWGYVEGEDSVTVVKTNRNFTIGGTFSASGSSNDWRWPVIVFLDGANICRKYLFKNVRFDYIGSYRYSGSTSYNRGIYSNADDYWNLPMIDGCVSNFSADGTTWVGNFGNNSGTGLLIRNSVMWGSYTAIWLQNNYSYCGSYIANNKILGVINGSYSSYQRSFSFNYNEIATCDTGIYMDGFRVERAVVPWLKEMKRNYIKGSSNSGIRFYQESYGPRRMPRFIINSNKIRAMDDYALYGSTYSGFPFVDSNFMAEHTGSRLTRYRNESWMLQGDTSSDLSWQYLQKNFGRFGYDTTFSVYMMAQRDNKTPNITRIYNFNGDAYFAMLGIELDLLEAVDFEVEVSFEYRIPLMRTLQDDGTNDGQIRIYNIQNGSILGYQYGSTPSSGGTGWQTFSGVFNTFTVDEGFAGVYLTSSSQNGYIDFKNARARVLTDSPNAIKVISNTFNLSKVWDGYGESRDTSPLTTANARTIALNRVKF